MVERWLARHGVAIRTGATLTAIEAADGRKRLRFREGEDLLADGVIMATGIRTNLEWLNGSGVRVNRGILVDDHLRSNVPNVYAAGDVAEGLDLVTGQPAVHAIEPTARVNSPASVFISLFSFSKVVSEFLIVLIIISFNSLLLSIMALIRLAAFFPASS